MHALLRLNGKCSWSEHRDHLRVTLNYILIAKGTPFGGTLAIGMCGGHLLQASLSIHLSML